MKALFVRNHCSLFFYVSFLVFSSCNSVPDQPTEVEDISSSAQVDETFLQYLKEQQKTQLELTKSPGASIHIVKDTAIYFQYLYGARDQESGVPVTENTLFRIGSLSKGFTGVLAAKLHEKGVLDLERPVVDYLPCLSTEHYTEVSKIKLYHLLSHSAGIVPHAYTLDLESGVLPMDLCHKYEQLITVSRREMHFYQNAFFALIEDIVEQQTGKPFNQVITEELFQPLDIRSVVFDHDHYVQSPDHAVPHRWSSAKEDYVKVPFKKKYYNAVSAGGISMSSADMCKWMLALLGKREDVISKEVLALAFRKYVDTRNDPRSVNKWSGVDSVHYGLGWRLVDYQGRELIYHGGYVDEFRSEILIDTKDSVGMFAVFNCASSYASKLMPSLLQSLALKDEIQNSEAEEMVAAY